MSEPFPRAVVNTLTRRQLVAGGAAGAAGLALSSGPLNYAALARSRRKPFAAAGRFRWGVSAGLPAPRGIVLWTRVGGLERSSRVRLEVASDPGFSRVAERRTVTAARRADYTVHAAVDGLRPDREYFYRFETRSSHSPVGRFRTAPPRDSHRPLRIGFYSCQSYEAGYYTALAGLAAEPDLDLVLCLGDYIYETHYYDGPADRVDRTGDNRDGEVQRLREYRQKYRLYQRDPNLRALHAAHPFVCIWDDHEVEDNYAGDEADATQDDDSLTNYGVPRRVPFGRRRRNGYRAFMEAMPRRGLDRQRIYGSMRLGGLAEIMLLDTRQYRDRQPCGGELLVPCPDQDQPGRTLLGAEQKAWLKRRLERSPARWKLLANQIMLMSLDGAPTLSLNVDGWDGYGAERRELMQHIVDRGVDNVVSLVGDIHTFFAGQVTTTGRVTGTPAATELVGGSATSLGIKELIGLEAVGPLGPLIRANNPHMIWGDFSRRGYGVLEVHPDELTCAFRSPQSTMRPEAAVQDLARFRVPAGRPVVQHL